jgi:hypothetical protein
MRTRVREATYGRAAKRAAAGNRFTPGTYVTDGMALFNVLGPQPDEPSLHMLEDCSTMDIIIVHAEDLLRTGVREVHPAAIA